MNGWDWMGAIGGMLGLLSAGFLLGLTFGVRVVGRSIRSSSDTPRS